MYFANMGAGTHPFETTFEYEIALWSLPDPDLSEGSVFRLVEDVDYDFWFANIDYSDNFSIEFATDELMQLQFSSDNAIYETRPSRTIHVLHQAKNFQWN